MIACSLTAARNLLKMKRNVFFAGAAAASALIFLGCMYILYSLENKNYWPLNIDRAQMLVIHLWPSPSARQHLRSCGIIATSLRVIDRFYIAG